ncbi:MAG TPA: NADH-quinone oxidoreductase subunit C [Hyphomicrobium sp.]
MSFLSALIDQSSRVGAHRPWPRVIVDTEMWREAVIGLAAGEATLLGLWSDGDAVHMALTAADEFAVVSLPVPQRRFPSVALSHAPALRLERTLRDLYGLEPEGAFDVRPWLDHNRWGVRHPLGDRQDADPSGDAYEFYPAEGPPMHQIPVGPVHAGIIEPGHFRFTANGEAVVRLEQRLGYVHKGIDALMIGAPIERAAKLAGRTSGDSTVAYAIAFARAVEAALEIEAPPRAQWLRALMAELERMANHLGDFGAICNDASFALMLAQCGLLREQVLRASDACFGHRLMMDRVVPGGTAADLDEAGVGAVSELVARLRKAFPPLIALYDNTASLQDRTVTTGIVKPELARLYGAGGFVGRASGRPFDARRTPGYAPYSELTFEVPVRDDGDVNARVWIRIREIEQSLALIEQIIDRLPAGAVRTDLTTASGSGDREGIALAEAFRGDVLAWVRIAADGTIARAHLRDASWFQWPLLEAAIEGNIVADFPLCNKSFNCSYSGHDL